MGKKILKKTLNVLAAIVTSLLLVVLVTVLSILFKPSLIVNETTLNLAAGFANQINYDIQWSTVQIEADSLALFHKRFAIDFYDLCITQLSTKSSFCFKDYEAAAEVAYIDGKIKIPSLGPVLITKGQILINLPTKEPSQNKKKAFVIPKLIFPKQLLGSQFHDIMIEIETLKLKAKDKTYRGQILVRAAPLQTGELNEMNVKANFKEEHGKLAADFFGRLSSPSYFVVNEWKLEGLADVTMKKKQSLKTHIVLSKFEDGPYAYRIQNTYQKDLLQGTTLTEGRFENKTLSGTMNGNFKNVTKNIPQLDVNNCTFSHKETDKDKNDGKLDLRCPMTMIVLPPINTPSQYRNVARVPNNVSTILTAHSDLFFFPDMTKVTSGSINLELLPVQGGTIITDGFIKSQFSGVPEKFPKAWKITTNLDVLLKIANFQNLVRSLNQTRFAIPAPFHVLTGQIEMRVSGKGNPLREKETFPLKFTAKLDSPEQRIHMEGEGETRLIFAKQASPELKMDVELSDVQLALPNIELAGLPQLVPDKRIKSETPTFSEKTKPSAFKYEITVKTPQDHPVRLLTQRTKTFIPVSMDLKMIPSKILGKISLSKFDFNILRRNATMDHFTLDLQDPQSNSLLDGLVSLRYSTYKIKVLFLGTMKRPRVILDSSPPLSQEDIIAVILYGKPNSELDTVNSNNVSTVRAAIADRTLSLAMLFILGTTPIQHFSYNPTTEMFNASVNLNDKTSLSIGSNWQDYSQVGLRRNIGHNFVISTYLTNPEDSNDKQGSAFLEWSKRY